MVYIYTFDNLVLTIMTNNNNENLSKYRGKMREQNLVNLTISRISLRDSRTSRTKCRPVYTYNVEVDSCQMINMALCL